MDIHPAVQHVLNFFRYDGSNEAQRALDVAFASLADLLVQRAPASQETTVALRKLLEAKDAAVRATQP